MIRSADEYCTGIVPGSKLTLNLRSSNVPSATKEACPGPVSASGEES